MIKLIGEIYYKGSMITSKDLTYVFQDNTVGLNSVNLSLPSGSRTLLIGANGAGKSTLLRLLAGKTLAKQGEVAIDGRDPFREGLQETAYLGTEWATNTTVRRDIAVTLLISSVGGDAYPERRDELVDILDIDLTWRMHQISDGERRRVQLCMGLLRPWSTLLLDEVTVDLDVIVRARLLQFLKSETEQRNSQVVYATHIFDGLMDWPTHVAHIHLGTILSVDTFPELLKKYEYQITDRRGTILLEIALRWLENDLKERGDRKPKRKWLDVTDPSKELEHGDKFTEYFKLTRT